MAGGAVPNLPGPDGTGLNATDLTITHNAYYKDPALYKYEAWSANAWVRKGKVINGGNGYQYIATTSGTTGASAPAFPTAACAAPPVCSGACCVADGTVTWEKNFFFSSWWTFKNLLEFKTAKNVSVKWNTFDGSWSHGQSGTPLLINCGAQDYIGEARCENLEYAYNVVRHAPQWITISSGAAFGDAVVGSVKLHDNLVIDPWDNSATGIATVLMIARANAPPYLTGLSFVHNTVKHSNVLQFLNFSNGYAAGEGKYEKPVFTDNLFGVNGAPYPVLCTACPSATTPKLAMDQATSGRGGYTFLNNVVAGENLSRWPNGNFNTDWLSIGFNSPDNGDYRLQGQSAYKGVATDGTDLGADLTQLPLIQDLLVSTNDRAALFTWAVTDPIAQIPCVIEISSDRDLSTVIEDLNPSAFTRPDTSEQDRLPRQGKFRAFVAGLNTPLATAATYWYRLHCGGALAQGSFTTRNAISGTSQINVSKSCGLNSTGFEVEWGSSYSRLTDVISGGGSSQAVCDADGMCSAAFEVPAGSVAYYRIHEMDSSGQMVSGPVKIQLVNGDGQ